MKKLISIVIPAYNEEEVIPKLTSALVELMDKNSRYNFEVIVVEHGSKDETLRELLIARKKDKRIKIVELAKNVGCDGGIIAGLSNASGNAAVVMMADLQDDPKLISQFIKKWEEGYDVVYAIVTKRPSVKLYKKVGATAFYWLMDILSKGLVPQNVSDYRLMDRKVYRTVVQMPEHNKFFRGLVSWTGFKQTGIKSPRLPRAAGTPKSDLITLIKIASNGALVFSTLPLKLPWLFALLFFLGGLFFSIFSNIILGVFLFSFSFFSILIGIQGEYIARILDESRNRPNFIVRELHGFKK